MRSIWLDLLREYATMYFMNIIAIAIACVVLFAGAYIGKKELTNEVTNEVTKPRERILQEEVLSEEDRLEDVAETPFETSESVTVTQTQSPSPTSTPIQSSSNTNVYKNSTSVNNKVKVYVKNGQKYAEVNGKEVLLDEGGCYDYQEGGTKIHACAN